MSAECKRYGPNLNHFSINHFAKQIIQLYQCHVRINISEFCNFTISARTGTYTHTHTVWHTGRVHFIRLYRISVESFAEPTLHAVQFFPRQLWWRCALQRITRKKEKNEFEINTQWSLLLLRFVRASDWKMCVIYHVAVSAK